MANNYRFRSNLIFNFDFWCNNTIREEKKRGKKNGENCTKKRLFSASFWVMAAEKNGSSLLVARQLRGGGGARPQ